MTGSLDGDTFTDVVDAVKAIEHPLSAPGLRKLAKNRELRKVARSAADPAEVTAALAWVLGREDRRAVSP